MGSAMSNALRGGGRWLDFSAYPMQLSNLGPKPPISLIKYPDIQFPVLASSQYLLLSCLLLTAYKKAPSTALRK
jgi:hypothetical protein